jgi:hypothetical protein
MKDKDRKGKEDNRNKEEIAFPDATPHNMMTSKRAHL